MSVVVSKSAKILVANFFDKYFTADNKEEAKQSAFEIVDLLLDEEQLKDFATKDDINRLEHKIIESKYDLLKWLITAQLAIAGLLLALIKLV